MNYLTTRLPLKFKLLDRKGGALWSRNVCLSIGICSLHSSTRNHVLSKCSHLKRISGFSTASNHGFVSFFVLFVCLFVCFSLGKRAVVGYEDGSVRVWDLKQGNAVHVIKGKSLSSSPPSRGVGSDASNSF